MSLIQDLKDRASTKIKYTPRFHGNGFTQLYLSERVRLHVWNERLVKLDDHNAQIHNHRYGVKSRVLQGALKHEVFAVVPLAFGEHRVWSVEGRELKPSVRVQVTSMGVYTMVAGSEYTFPNPFFHTSDADQFTVTIFEIGEDQDHAPMVVAPNGQTPTDAFRESPFVGDLWRAIADACVLNEHEIAAATDWRS